MSPRAARWRIAEAADAIPVELECPAEADLAMLHDAVVEALPHDVDATTAYAIVVDRLGNRAASRLRSAGAFTV